jgi:hypothetical protein
MDRPELPHPYFWKNDTTINAHIGHGATENVAWFFSPEYRIQENTNKYQCVSAPVGIVENFYRTDVDTEQEAISLIVSFALLGVTKE